MLLLSLILIDCVEEFFVHFVIWCPNLSEESPLSNVQYMYSIHQHKRSPLKIKFAAAACDQSCCMDGKSILILSQTAHDILASKLLHESSVSQM